MRILYLLGVLVILVLALIACGSGAAAPPKPAANLPPAVQAAMVGLSQPEMAAMPAVVKVAAPLSTVEPRQDRPFRSYPAPTGAPGFRKYYQMRCYPGCHSYPSDYGLSEAPTVQPTATPTVSLERVYRSYPAPTGAPGFRKYYQMRCYPGCHTYPSAAEPTKVHP
jgi:hypothetical protein